MSLDEAIRDLFRAGLVSYQPDVQELPASGFITVIAEPAECQRHEIEWRKALEAAHFNPSVAASLADLAVSIADMTPADMEGLATALKALSDNAHDAANDAGFNVSAKHIMGGSKVLSMLTRRMLDSLGLPMRLHNASPKYVVCAGPSEPIATLLIENPRAFENAVRSGLADEVALLCTFGFGLSYLGQEWLHSAETPEHDRPVLIVRQGTPPPLAQMLGASNVFLWADLDLAALNIFRSLKGAIPQLRMSKIYQVMVPMLLDLPRSHPYAVLFGKNGQTSRSGRDEDMAYQFTDVALASLQSACMRRAVDQEAVDDQTIRLLGAYPYEGLSVVHMAERAASTCRATTQPTSDRATVLPSQQP